MGGRAISDHGREDLRDQALPQPLHLLGRAALDVPSEGVLGVEAVHAAPVRGPRSDHAQELRGLVFDAVLKLRPITQCSGHAAKLRRRRKVDVVLLEVSRERTKLLVRCIEPALLGRELLALLVQVVVLLHHDCLLSPHVLGLRDVSLQRVPLPAVAA
eukprot:867034-Pyramimonas_sp.AAC.1